jgi:hypothetical protein
MTKVPKVAAVFTALCLAAAAATPAQALYRGNFLGGDFGPGGRLEASIFRHQDFDRWAFIQQRNELKLRMAGSSSNAARLSERPASWLDRADALRGLSRHLRQHLRHRAGRHPQGTDSAG